MKPGLLDDLHDPSSLAGAFSPQLGDLLSEGDADVLIPLGSLEQHGPHLPLGTDSAIAQRVAIAVAQQVEGLLVAPCLPIGCSDPHLAFSGTASISAETLIDYLDGVVGSLLGHGFRHAYVTTGHVGNIPAMERAIQGLDPELRGRVAAFTDWTRQRVELHRWAASSLGMSPEVVGSHAGHFETSIMLFLHPEMVDSPSARAGYVGPLEEALAEMRTNGMQAVSDIGVMGDPREATRDAGAAYFQIMVDALKTFITTHRKANKGSDRDGRTRRRLSLKTD